MKKTIVDELPSLVLKDGDAAIVLRADSETIETLVPAGDDDEPNSEIGYLVEAISFALNDEKWRATVLAEFGVQARKKSQH